MTLSVCRSFPTVVLSHFRRHKLTPPAFVDELIRSQNYIFNAFPTCLCRGRECCALDKGIADMTGQLTKDSDGAQK